MIGKWGMILVVFTLVIMGTGTGWAADLPVFDGIIEPSEVVDVGTPSRGVIARIEVEKSDEVRAGQVLVELDSTVERATAARAGAQSKIEGEIKLQQEKLAFAKRAYDRLDDLFISKAISTQKKDEAETEVAIAQYRLQKAKENQELAKLDLQRARAMLNQRRIKSPIAGVVMERFVSPGEFVDDTPLLRLARIDPLQVEVVLPATMFGRLKKGMLALVHSELQQEQEYQAQVNIVDRVLDSASGTFRVRLLLPNPDYQIASGLKCTVSFPGLEDTSVLAGEEGQAVFATKSSGLPANAHYGTPEAQTMRGSEPITTTNNRDFQPKSLTSSAREGR